MKILKFFTTKLTKTITVSLGYLLTNALLFFIGFITFITLFFNYGKLYLETKSTEEMYKTEVAYYKQILEDVFEKEKFDIVSLQ